MSSASFGLDPNSKLTSYMKEEARFELMKSLEVLKSKKKKSPIKTRLAETVNNSSPVSDTPFLPSPSNMNKNSLGYHLLTKTMREPGEIDASPSPQPVEIVDR
jgi:hypothetical protein